ncbi:hypothetical protein NIES4073_64550 [Kalymmatonema gypsitolerans NIES-4073]|nr:hypothetical protein NIES4073_64550 [Scytonema sp. NIES-4073]
MAFALFEMKLVLATVLSRVQIELPGFVTFGLLQGRVIAVVHTEREDCTRIISARKATKYEQRVYFQQLSN